MFVVPPEEVARVTLTPNSGKPVVFKRGMASTIDEWLQASNYITMHGNENVIFCERGIRTFETAYRNVLDVTAELDRFRGEAERILLARVPKPLQDTSIALVTAGILSLTFYAFKGMV